MTRSCPVNDRIRLGIIGCGAIAEESHLPAALASDKVQVTCLSDSNAARLHALCEAFGQNVARCISYEESFNLVDAVVLALPNHLHASIGCEFLRRGIHVLCEKPLSVSVRDCEEMCSAADSAGAVLSVGYVTRFFPSTELTRNLITDGLLGYISSMDYEFGTAGGWSPLSGYNITRECSGGGVLTVSGSHFIDRMLYFFGDPHLVSYADDSHGGVEANCIAQFKMEMAGNSFPGTVTLSKTHQLGNRLRLIGNRGTLLVGEGQKDSVTFVPSEGGLQHEISSVDNPRVPRSKEYYWQVQLEDLVAAIQTGRRPRVDGMAGMRSVQLIAKCYEGAVALDEPWVNSTLQRLVPRPAEAKPHLAIASC
jgi:predicted dehydrogenase